MTTTVLSTEDPETGRWVEVQRDGQQVDIRAGTSRRRLGTAARRGRLTVTEWTISGRNPHGPMIQLVRPTPQSTVTRLGGMAADVALALDQAGGTGDGGLAGLVEHVAGALGLDDEEGRQHGLLGVTTAAAFPLLGAAMRRGTPPPPSIPAPVTPYLRAPDPRTAAQRAFGRRATRPVVRALATSMLGDDGRAPALEPLATAVIGTTVLPAERIAELLALRPPLPGSALLAAREVATGQDLFGRLHPAVAHRLLCEAVESAAGPTLLAEVLAAWERAGRPEPPGRPRELRLLRDDLASRPPAHVVPPRPTAGARPAPDPTSPRSADPYPSDLRALHGRRVGDLVIDVPADAEVLLAWGRAMENCLGSFRTAVAAGRSHVIGYRRRGRLTYAVELTAQRSVRQLEGVGGARPGPGVARRLLEDLAMAGVLRGFDPRRRPGNNLAPAL